eukprot:TRINITY_DN4731_c0_g1_i1.p1 TRINITY_DN4731_c0_g1~~TRINITY_DN4731_c0_g1_i1.p1  ORF type:complete len:286 (-),score=36.90 TRINITY_DN4731_c0_g1_i1:995-1852(-)
MFHTSLIDLRFRPIEGDLTNSSPKTLSEFLVQSAGVQKEDLNLVYSHYLKPLRRTYTNLVKEYEEALEKLTSQVDDIDVKELMAALPKRQALLKERQLSQEEEKKEVSTKPRTMSDTLSASHPIFLSDKGIKINSFSESSLGRGTEETENSLLQELNVVAGQLYSVWFAYLTLMMLAPKSGILGHFQNYLKRVQEKWGECMYRKDILVEDFGQTEDELSEDDRIVAAKVRKQAFPSSAEPMFRVEQLGLFPTAEQQTILFEQAYIRDSALELKKTVSISRVLLTP